MLGKTNLTTIKDGAIVSDIAQYSWNNAGVSGISGTFIKAVYGGGFLVGITSDGDIAYTSDGENWEKTRLDSDRYYLTDVIWDGKQYALVGFIPVEGDGDEIVAHGIIVTTIDLTGFSIIEDEENYYSKYFSILKIDGYYILIGERIYNYENIYGGESKKKEIFYKVGEIGKWEKKTTVKEIGGGNNDYTHINVRKNSNGFIVYVRYEKLTSPGSTGNRLGQYFEVLTSANGIEYKTIVSKLKNENSINNEKEVSIFECKDSLYFNYNNSDYKYELAKLINLDESATISTDINFAFVDAAYFNKCEIFINNHKMLILTPSENTGDKTLDDLVDITYDFSMTAIVKAFDKLYIFGTGGNVLVSSDEVNNEEALAVKTMSASKALYEAKTYADTRYAELEARVAALEESDAT